MAADISWALTDVLGSDLSTLQHSLIKLSQLPREVCDSIPPVFHEETQV